MGRGRGEAQVHRDREQRIISRDQQRALADVLTREAEEAIESLRSTLAAGLRRDPSLDFVALERHHSFPAPSPQRPALHVVARAPQRASYGPTLTFGDYVLPPLRRRKEQQAEQRFHADTLQWEKHRDGVVAANKALERDYDQAVREWNDAKAAFFAGQQEHNAAIAVLRQQYFAGEPEAIVEYCDRVLSASPYPDFFPRAVALNYTPAVRRLLVDYDVPAPETLPRLKDVKYNPSKGLVEHELSATVMQKLYDDVLYQIALRSLYELFTADQVQALQSIAFNGWVHAVDKRTGHDTYAPILSLHVTRDELLALDLARVEPKACFRQLKGVAGSKLADLAVVQPIVQVDRDDRRFVAPHDVLVQEGDYLAAMDWEDFEHLIRELFEQEFSANGGEVHITRASRDAGVDAIAFDPDPIRGGKIVIQAKRYTNTVDLSAVRDLYGTVHNEGATKGILVTTADFGADAYDFVKGKPLTLLNGSNLLYLLQKHGRKARIDLHEAREVLQGQPRAPQHASRPN